MSVIGIASNILSTLSGTQNQQNQQNPFQQIRSEFKQLGQDLQAGNLAQAQSDFTTLSQNLSSVLQNNTSTSANPVVQAFAKLGQDLQSGNLQAAQQDFTAIEQDTSQNAAQSSGHHHHHHHVESSSNSSSSQQSSSLAQDFTQLANSLQSGNLSAAQSAFATLQNDIQQIGGTSAPATAGSVNVTV
jgi:ElaB/YqjD/DUF883 family membrane-anchored ribosome-binding protein